MSWTTCDLARLPVVAAAVALALFAGGLLRLRRRAGARYADGWRVPLFVLAVALATLPVISPLDQAGDEYLLSPHMLQHVLLGDAAPALALVALRGPLLFFVLPAPILRLLGHRRLLRGTLAFLLRPSVSLAVWALVIGAWHIPAAYDYALGHQTVHDIEHLSRSSPLACSCGRSSSNLLIVIGFAPRSDSAACSRCSRLRSHSAGSW